MSLENIDAVDALMSQYAAGALPAPARVLVECHLELKDNNRQLVNNLEAIAGMELERAEPSILIKRNERLDDIFSSQTKPLEGKISADQISDDHAHHLPHALRTFLGKDLDEIKWRNKLPGFKTYDLGEIDGCSANLFYIRAGRAIPAHTHRGCELSIVLDGSFTDERGVFGKGDISVADASIAHRPVAGADRPCIGFAVLDEGLRMTGSFRQLLGDLLG